MTAENPFARAFRAFASSDEFAYTQTETVSWPIPYLLPPGLTLMTGGAHCGKTSLAYQLALHVARGQNAFDEASDLRATSGHAFFLGLDSSDDHLKRLAKRYLKAHPETRLPSMMRITNTWKDLTPDEGLAELQREFSLYPDVRLFVIDNLASLRTLFRGNDRKLFTLLRSIAEQQGISILLLHTARASTPLATYADHHLHLKRHAISSYYHLDVVGRDMAPTSFQLYCRPDAISFRLVTCEEEFALATHGAQRAPTSERMALLSVFIASDKEVLTPSQMAAALEVDEFCVRHVLEKMLRARLLTSPTRQHYALSASIMPLLAALLDQYPRLPNLKLEDLPEPTEAEEKALAEAQPISAESEADTNAA